MSTSDVLILTKETDLNPVQGKAGMGLQCAFQTNQLAAVTIHTSQ